MVGVKKAPPLGSGKLVGRRRFGEPGHEHKDSGKFMAVQKLGNLPLHKQQPCTQIRSASDFLQPTNWTFNPLSKL
ncbi:hypothetical protein PHAVU_009G070700 [Phaseolus vulgaris]|uniref:Uncharacterized protein n=1 Tax=Phaseolus vulgaris TaxID=3885 RepID=V7ATW3_PHAVU|nr:hypothetical protein PHAVU_009G070700g [Phaseolus vulgaris]ESW08740.1 hypothetical protein PHAVU_009G070700g [Phaseolus vulgaris]